MPKTKGPKGAGAAAADASPEDIKIDAAPGAPKIPASEPVIEKEIASPPPVFDEPVDPESFAYAVLHDPDKNISRTVSKFFTRHRDPYYSEWNSASEIGDPCIRRIVYQRLSPELALPEPPDLMFIFKHGHWVEKEVYAELAEAGYEVVEQQRPFVDRDLKIKGKIDGKIVMKWKGRTYRPPFDAKGYSPAIWSSVDSAKDFLESDQPFLKKVPAQITLYNVLDKENEAKVGLVYMKNKVTGQPKQVAIPLVQSYVDWLLKRTRMVNDFVARKELPPRIEYDETVCEKCPFRAACLKETPRGALNPVVLDPEKEAKLLGMLQERERLDPLRKSFKDLDGRISAIVRGHSKIIIGDFVISGKWVTEIRLNQEAIPAKTKKKYMKDNTYWKKKITNLKAEPKPEDEGSDAG